MALNFNDPLYAYNTPGYTNQNDGGAAGTLTSNVEGANVTLGSVSELIEPAALSGFITRTLDPDVTTAGGAGSALTLVSQTAYLASVYVLQPAVCKQVTYIGSASGTSTHFTIGLYSATTGAKLAATADQGATGVTSTLTTLAWATSLVLSPGFYWVLLLSVNSGTNSIAAFTLSAESQTLLTGTGVTNFVPGTSLRFLTGTTNLSSLGAGGGLPTALTASMAGTATAKGYFIGLS